MSILSKDTIKAIGESVGLNAVSDEVAQALAADTEYRIREIIQEGMKIMRHSRRNKLTTEDLNSALRLRNVEVLYGYSSPDPLRFVRVAGQKDLFYIEDNEIDLNELVQSIFTTNPATQTSFYKLPKVPKQTSFTLHWLAVEGVQPRIPQNPNYTSEITDGKKRKADGISADESLTTGTHTTRNVGATAEMKPTMKHILSKEQQLFYKKVTELILSTASIFSTSEIQKTLTKPPAIPISQILQSPGPQTTPTQITSVTNVQNVQNVQATMPTTLPVSSTQSQPQLLTPTATTTIPSTGTTHITPAIWAAASTAVLEATFRIIASESGLQQLLPYFTKFISEEVSKNLKHLPILKALMQFVRALLNNPHLHIEPYLHQLMPAILTCLVGKRLCEDPFDNHWELRDYTANLVHDICKRFGKDYRDLQPRVIKTLLHAFLDPTKPMTTHYGAIVGLGMMGPLVIQSLLLPNMIAYLTLLLPELNSSNEIKRLEAGKCYEALLNVAGTYLSYACSVAIRMEKFLPRPRKGTMTASQQIDVDEQGTSLITSSETGQSPSAPVQTQFSHQPQRKTSPISKPVSMDVEEGSSSTTESKKTNQSSLLLKQLRGTALQELLPDIATYYDQLFEIFGERLLPFIREENSSVFMPQSPQSMIL